MSTQSPFLPLPNQAVKPPLGLVLAISFGIHRRVSCTYVLTNR